MRNDKRNCRFCHCSNAFIHAAIGWKILGNSQYAISKLKENQQMKIHKNENDINKIGFPIDVYE